MSSNAFRASFPVTLTSFINKCGEIGLNLLPMVLIEKQASEAQASTVLGAIKIALPIGVFLGGYLSDRIGTRTIYLISFGLSALGLSLIPFAHPLWLIAFCGVLAQLGKAFFTSSSRMILTQIVPENHRKESLGWFRTGNNLGQIASYTLGALFSSLGTSVFFIFDGATSFLAMLLGFRWIPKNLHSNRENKTQTVDVISGIAKWKPIALYGLMIGGFNFVYELYMLSVSASSKLIYGDQGLKIFSIAMIINTVFCTILAVPAANYFKKPVPTLSVGILLLSLGASATYFNIQDIRLLYLGIFLVTLGEIVFASLAQFVLLQMTNKLSNPGSAYATAMTIQTSLRALSGALSFPLIVHGQYAVALFILFAIPSLSIVFMLRKKISLVSQ